MIKLKQLMIVVLIILINSITFAANLSVTAEDSLLLLDRLLSLSEPQKAIKDKLLKYQEWEKVYEKYSKIDRYNKDNIKIYLFICFISNEKVLTHTNEDISFEIVKKFEKQPKLFLEAVKKIPFLNRSLCNDLVDGFYILNKQKDLKKFKLKHKKIVLEVLGNEVGMKFLRCVYGVDDL